MSTCRPLLYEHADLNLAPQLGYLEVLQGRNTSAHVLGLFASPSQTVRTFTSYTPHTHATDIYPPFSCFLYLFPAHQTWFLVVVFFFLTYVFSPHPVPASYSNPTYVLRSAVEWSGFIVLDIGLDVVDSIPRGPRVLAGLFQSLGVRASGFSIVSIGSLAPACRFLYIIMMCVSLLSSFSFPQLVFK